MLANLSNGRWHKSGKWGRSSVSGELDFDRTADKVGSCQVCQVWLVFCDYYKCVIGVFRCHQTKFLAKFSSVHLVIRTRLIGWFLGGKSALSVGLNSFRNTQHSCALLCTRTRVTIWVSTDFMWSDFWLEPIIDAEDEHTKDILKKKNSIIDIPIKQHFLHCVFCDSHCQHIMCSIAKCVFQKWIDHLCNGSGYSVPCPFIMQHWEMGLLHVPAYVLHNRQAHDLKLLKKKKKCLYSTHYTNFLGLYCFHPGGQWSSLHACLSKEMCTSSVNSRMSSVFPAFC